MKKLLAAIAAAALGGALAWGWRQNRRAAEDAALWAEATDSVR